MVTDSKIPDGYKLTEVGVIPNAWEVKKLGDCLISNPEYGINAAAVPYNDNLPIYIRITDISEDGRFISENKSSVNHMFSSKYYLETGDLVFARTGASVGKTYLYNPSDDRLVFAGFLIRVKVNPEKLIPGYLKSFTETRTYWNWVTVMSMRSGQPGINGNEYKELPIPLPPTIYEQTAIAAALSDVDNLITSLNKIINKKINIKQGTTQELLTGKKRLPGFSGEWEVKNLDNVGSFKKGRNIPKKDLTSEGIPCVLYGEIYTKYNYISKELSSFIPPSVAQQSTYINKGDILFAGSGETTEDIGKCFTYLGDENAYAGGDLNILSPRNADPVFLGYLLNSPQVVRRQLHLSVNDNYICASFGE